MSPLDRGLRDAAIEIALRRGVKPVKLLDTSKRKGNLSWARWEFFHHCRVTLGLTCSRIQRFYSDRGYTIDHTSILYGVKKYQEALDAEECG